MYSSIKLDKKIFASALRDAFGKLNPAVLVKNPVIFIVAIGSLITTFILFIKIFNGEISFFELQIALWLWFTVLFANFAEAIAEGRGKAQADALRKSRTQITARKITGTKEERVPATELKKGDLVVCEVNDVIPSDGEVTEGVASVDESAITGESAPVIREAGGDRSAVTGGTTVLSDRIIIKITSEPGNTFMDKLISLVEGAKRQKTPNEISLTILLAGLTIIFLLVVITLPYFAVYANGGSINNSVLTIPVLISLLVCL
ncbi:MAG: HAD-IC family P-type ATPase, partial [Ignavibacteria bacterium]|nr:HAD-IC family P-type ATPase [Ignavibacteria bacterium]